jgi:hypothetical protein
MLQSEVAPRMSSLSMRRLLMRAMKRSTKLFQNIVGEVFSLLFIGRILRLLRNVYRSKTNIR